MQKFGLGGCNYVFEYILDGKTPRPCDDRSLWAQSFFANDNHIAEDYVGDIHISTVFLGYDASHGITPDPLFFETMIFGGEFDRWQCQWSTWEDAIAGHQFAVFLVKTSYEPGEVKLPQGFIWTGLLLAIAILLIQTFF